MRLSQYADFALRLLVHLAVAGRRLTVAEIATAQGLSRHHLTKIANDLARAGLVRTVRGKGGGLELARAPEEIRLGRLMRGLERDLALAECFDPDSCRCRLQPVCRMTGYLERACASFFDTLDERTLADLVEPRAELRRTLGLDAEERP